MSTGKVIRMFTIVDDCTRECPAIELDMSFGGLRVRRALDRLASERRLPEAIVVELWAGVSRSSAGGLERRRVVRLEFIQPGKPAQNAYAQSFNGLRASLRLVNQFAFRHSSRT